jgi:LysR family carnitine catabolism transcriptional activator
MPELLATFGRRYPGIQVHLREGIQMDVLDDVRSGVADFAIGYVDGMPDSIVGEELTKERFHVALRKSHPLASQKRIALESLQQQTLVSFSRDSRSRRIVDGTAAAIFLVVVRCWLRGLAAAGGA